MTQNSFASLGLSEPILRALEACNYTTPTPIQDRAIPHLLQGRDLLGIAQTGTGKTAAFGLPMLQLLAASRTPRQPRMPRSLVLAPTRELATQIVESLEAYGAKLGMRVARIFGGVGQQPQVQALHRGLDILVATPGRLLDLIDQRHCDLRAVEILVLDEADRMLDMGFLPDVKRVIQRLPQQRQSLLFSATMPPDIASLAKNLLVDPLRIEVTPPAATADRVEQSVYFVEKDEKRDRLGELLADPQFVRTLVFTRTKHGADKVAKHLVKIGIDAHAIHGNKSQSARERALEQFREGTTPVLVATDIAARGIDVAEISHVVNFELPNIPESYVHRIGRTARAGREGIAISFCDREEREYLRDIEKLIRKRIPVLQFEGATAPARAPHAREHGEIHHEGRPRPAPRQESHVQHGRPQHRDAAAARTHDDHQRSPQQGGPLGPRHHGDRDHGRRDDRPQHRDTQGQGSQGRGSQGRGSQAQGGNRSSHHRSDDRRGRTAQGSSGHGASGRGPSAHGGSRRGSGKGRRRR